MTQAGPGAGAAQPTAPPSEGAAVEQELPSQDEFKESLRRFSRFALVFEMLSC